MDGFHDSGNKRNHFGFFMRNCESIVNKVANLFQFTTILVTNDSIEYCKCKFIKFPTK